MKHLIAEFETMRRRFPAGFESSLVLPCLRRIQEDRGYVADADIDGLAGYLGVPRIQIEEVLSFYTQFRRAPIGRWRLLNRRSDQMAGLQSPGCQHSEPGRRQDSRTGGR